MKLKFSWITLVFLLIFLGYFYLDTWNDITYYKAIQGECNSYGGADISMDLEKQVDLGFCDNHRVISRNNFIVSIKFSAILLFLTLLSLRMDNIKYLKDKT